MVVQGTLEDSEKLGEINPADRKLLVKSGIDVDTWKHTNAMTDSTSSLTE